MNSLIKLPDLSNLITDILVYNRYYTSIYYIYKVISGELNLLANIINKSLIL